MILFLLDLNGILCKSSGAKASPRPHLTTFLRHIEKRQAEGKAQFAIWTSKMEHNALPIIETLFNKADAQSFRTKLLFCWYKSHCTPIYTDEDPYAVVKDLEHVWHFYPQFDETNTYLVDDTPSKIGKYTPNLIHVPAFEGPRKAPNDCALLDLCAIIDSKLGSL